MPRPSVHAPRQASPAGGRSAEIAATRQHLLDLLGPVVTAAGYDLDDVVVTAAGRRSLVRVSVDADGGIDLDAVAEVTRIVSDALDSDTVGDSAFAGPYVLEVSSPGVDRPLTERRHWRRATGRLVAVTVGERSLTARIVDVADDGVTLEIGDDARELVAWPDLGRGMVQVEFNPPHAARLEAADSDDGED